MASALRSCYLKSACRIWCAQVHHSLFIGSGPGYGALATPTETDSPLIVTLAVAPTELTCSCEVSPGLTDPLPKSIVTLPPALARKHWRCKASDVGPWTVNVKPWPPWPQFCAADPIRAPDAPTTPLNVLCMATGPSGGARNSAHPGPPSPKNPVREDHP